MKVVILEVTFSCNHQCQFCYNPWRNPQSKTYPTQPKILLKEEFFTIIDKVKKWGVDTLAFSGGEPLLNEELFEIAEYSKDLGFKNSLLTNGMLVERYVKEISESFDFVQLSIHGTPEIHDTLTGMKGSLNQTLKGRIALLDYDLPVSAAIVVNRINLVELWNIIGLAASMDMSSILVNRFLPGGKGLQNAKGLNLTETEVFDMLDTVEKACEEFGIPPFIGTPTPPCLKDLRKYSFMLKDGCMAGKGLHCAMDPSGNLKVCNHSPIILGNCLTSDPKTIYETSQYVKGFQELRYTPEMCKDCPKIDICKGGCREAARLFYGSINAPDPVFDVR